MGFDNECILNIQSLPGEYFCPVCRTLIYPNEALQAQCTHLYCKPCLAYVVATTQACPYDGYLVTQADSKTLTESNKTLAETIGKVAVHCLYHRSGCTWQGGLSECITHCTDCTFGNSPVLCNRCGAQIMHRQVQEHAQICPGVQPQAQQAEAQATTVQAQPVAQDKKPVVSAAAPTQATPTVTTGPSVATSVATAAVVAPASAPALAAAAVGQAQTPTAEQWYQQQQQLQYQQYYQQYPGYDPYQQQYQQYAQYQQQPHTQYPQPQMNPPQQVIQGHPQQPQYLGPQPQPQPQPQLQPQPQPQAIQQPLQQQVPPQFQPQLQPQNPQPHVQRPQMQPQNTNLPAHQLHPQAQPQTHLQPHQQMAGQPMVQPQTQPYHAQPLPQQLQPPPQLQTAPQHQQPLAPPQMQHPQQHPHPQPQLQQHPTQLQPHPQSQPPLAQPQPLPHQPPAVTGHQSYPPQQPLQQIPPNTPQQRPMHPLPQPYQQYPQQPVQAQGQFQPQQPHQMMPHAQVPMQIGPQGVPPQGPHMPQQAHHHAPHQGQPIHQQPVMQPHPQQPHPMHPQQQMRPQGSPYMQQPPQQNVTHHPQALAVRPMGPGQSMPLSQQSPGGPGKLVPHALNQQASVQNYPVTGRMPLSSEQQSGSSAAPVPQSGIAAQQVPPPSSLDKDPKISEIVGASKSTQLHAEGAESADLKDPKKDSDSAGDGENNGDVQPNSGKDVLGPAKSESKEVKEEAIDHPNEGAKSSNSIRSAEGEKGIQSTEVDADGKFVNRAEAENLQPSDGTVTVQSLTNSGNIPKRSSSASHENENQALASQGQLVESINNKHAPSRQIPLPGGGVDQGMLQQQPQHHPLAPHQSFPPPSHHDRNISQFPQQGSGPGLSGPVPGQERYQGQPLPYPNQPNTSMVTHRPPAPDNMYPQNLPHHAPGQQRMFQEPPHHMQVHGQPVGPNQMRPPVHNFPEPRPQHLSAVPEPFQPPMGKQPYGPYQSEAPVPGFEAPGMMPPRVSGPGGPPFNRSFDEQGMLQPHASGPRGFPDGPIAQQGTAGAPGQSGMIPQRPPFRPEDQRGWPHPPTRMGTEAYPVGQPGFYDDRQHETHRPVPNEHGQFGQAHVQPTPMGSNGIPRNGPSIGSGFPLGVPDERFNLPEGGFKAAQVEQLRPSLNPGSRIMQFEEDLKKFPRPSHLEGEGPAKYDTYRGPPPFNHDAVPRPLDRVPYSSDGAGSLNSRPLPTTGPFPPRSGAPPSHLIDFGERQWPVPDRSGYGRRGDNDGLGGLPLRTGNDMNGPDILPNVKSRDGEPTSFGGFQSHLRRGDPAGPMNLSPHLRTGELTRGGVNYPNRGFPNEPGYFSSFPLHGDMDSFEHIRMRRSGSMGWCRICKIDCETVEGLDQHSQSREHQKMAMDMVMSIKRDSAKRKKINSEGNFPYEDANKMKF